MINYDNTICEATALTAAKKKKNTFSIIKISTNYKKKY